MNMSQIRKTGWTRGRIAAAALVLFLAGMGFRGCWSSAPPPPADGAAAPAEGKSQLYTCSMHPQVRSPDPHAKCPICAMDLIPVPADGDEVDSGDGPPRLRLTESALARMEVQTQPAERRAAEIELPLYGKVAVDESRVVDVVARVDGYVEGLAARTPWQPVKPGDGLAEFYAPAAVAALNELKALRSAPPDLREAAQARLRRMGVPEETAAGVLAGGDVPRTFPVASPIAGAVLPPPLRAGEARREGERLFRIADLSRVWINAEAFERDLPWLRPGLPASFAVAGLPGQEFAGAVAFIEPTVSDVSRTVRLRIEADNAAGDLRPDQFVSAKVRASYEKEPAPIVVPASALLLTGKRALVYVRVPDADRPTFEPRAVALGPRAGDAYVVEAGLAEGELVVVNGQFKIDSELQIRGRPSMMSAEKPEGQGPVGDGTMRLQTHCPVMNLPIDRALYHDHAGRRIYVCCPGCLEDVRKRADEMIREHAARGIAFERTPEEP